LKALFRGLVPSSARRGEGYALVQVANGSVRGLTNASPALSDALVAIAQGSGTSGRAAMRDDVRVASPTFPPRHVTFSNEDKVVGEGEARKLIGPLIGIYELRNSDAHLPRSDQSASLALVGVSGDETPFAAGTSLLDAVSGALMATACALRPVDRELEAELSADTD
jgi:hypothetical protein